MNANKITMIREAMNLSQAELAKMLDCSITTIYRWETGLNGVSHIYVKALNKILEEHEFSNLKLQPAKKSRNVPRRASWKPNISENFRANTDQST